MSNTITPGRRTSVEGRYDFLVFIGRFQPFHQGHLAVIRHAFNQADQVIVLCGSAHQARSTRNPWTVSERESMIRHALTPEESERVHISPLMDALYNDESWVRSVQATVNDIITARYPQPRRTAKIALIGHSKDQSSYYLNLFPQWGAVQASNHGNISATPIREQIFTDQGSNFLKQKETETLLPKAVIDLLINYCDTPEYEHITQESAFIRRYQKAWQQAPYPPTFVTVDAVIVQSGHILLVSRKSRPGKDLLALPGGFVDQNEKLIDACLRELREETRLKVPIPVLRGSIKQQQVFDDPHRSARGRTITHAFYIELAPNHVLPKVKGGDDAKHALWLPLANLKPSELFEDHYFVIQAMAGL